MISRPLAALAAALGILASAGTAATAPARPTKLDTPLQNAVTRRDEAPKRVIVRTSSGVDKMTAKLAARGHAVTGQLAFIGALTLSMTPQQALALAEDDDVDGISEDVVVRSSGIVAEPSLASAAGIQLNGGWTSATGYGVGVAIIDSGIDASTDFGTRITAFYDFTLGRARRVAPLDDYGHGTFVASVIGGTGRQMHSKYPGLAPRVRLIGLRVLDRTGEGLTSNVIAAVEFAVANRTALGIDVLNLSLGHPITDPAASDPLVIAVERAIRAGLVVVVSAGNFGTDNTGQIGYMGTTSPGNAPSAITVGAAQTFGTTSYADDRVADFSSRGPTWQDLFAKPDVVAPGHHIISNAGTNAYLSQNYPTLRVEGEPNGLSLSGTSVAAAVTSGAVALMLDANRAAFPGAPDMTPNQVKAILEFSAVLLRNEAGVEYDALTQGAGELNTLGAVAMAGAIAPAGSRVTSYASSPIGTYTMRGRQINAWSQRIIWGDAYLPDSLPHDLERQQHLLVGERALGRRFSQLRVRIRRHGCGFLQHRKCRRCHLGQSDRLG